MHAQVVVRGLHVRIEYCETELLNKMEVHLIVNKRQLTIQLRYEKVL